MRSLSKYFVLFVGTKSESSLRNDDVIQIENVFKTGNGDIAFNYIQNEHSYIGFHDSQKRNGYTSGLFSVYFRTTSGSLPDRFFATSGRKDYSFIACKEQIKLCLSVFGVVGLLPVIFRSTSG